MEWSPQTLRIVPYPDPVLRQVAQPIASVTDQVRQVAQVMLELMRAAPGVGLAAPQVGLSWRMFVANPTGDPADDQVFINPALSDPTRATQAHQEGCLSLPGIEGDITRPKGITITAMDLQGQSFTRTDDALPARIWQHENDHLDGVLIIDKMLPIDRQANRRLLKELEAAGR